MERISTPTALSGGRFTNGDPDNDIPPTDISAQWCQTLQEELAHLVEYAGMELNPGDRTQVRKAVQALVNRAGIAVPPGTSINHRGASVPEGYIVEDGGLYWIEKMPGLYAEIGNTYNNGIVPAGTFRVPDPSGRVTVAAGSGLGLTPRNVGDKGGAEAVALTVPQLARHTHGANVSDDSTVSPGALVMANSGPDGWSGGPKDMTELGDVLDINVDVTIDETGEGQPHNNMPPFLVGLSCIKIGIFDIPERAD